MMLQISSRLCCCKQLDRVIILRAIVTSSHRGAENKSPSSAIIDLKAKLRMSEGKCHDKSDHSKWGSQRPNKVKARVIPSKFNRAVTREQTVGLVERLRVMDEPKLQIKHKPELNQVSDLSVDLSPAGSQIEKNSEIEDDPVENLPRRILTPVKMRIPEGLEKTIEVFRDFPEKYPFLRLEVPSVAESPISPDFWLSFASLTKDKLDVLQAWKLASSSQDAILQREIISRLLENLPHYSYSELASITYNLSLLRHAPDQLAELTSMLDQQLTLKMREMMQEADEEQIEECLRVAFMWLRMMMQLRGGMGLLGDHNRALLKLLLTKHLRQLGSRHLVVVLALAGVHRTMPIHIKPSALEYDTGSPLPASLARALTTSLPVLGHREVGVICHALHQCGLYLETGHTEVRRLLLRALISFPDSLVLRHEFAMSSIAKYLKRRGSESHGAVVATMVKYQPHLKHLDIFSRIRLLQFVVTGFCGPTETRSFVEELCAATKAELNTLRIKDLEKLAFCLFYLNHEEVNAEYAPLIADAVQKCSWDGVKAGLSFVYLTSLLAKLGCKEVESSMNQVLEAANPLMHVDQIHTDKGLAQIAQFLIGLNIPAYHQLPSHGMQKLVKKNRARVRNSLLQLLDIDSIREIQRLNITPLRAELRDKLVNYFHAGDQGVRVADLLDKRGRLKPADFTDQIKNFVHRDLVTLLGGDSMVWRGHAFPHSTKPDLFLLFDRKRQRPVPFPSDFRCFGQGAEGIFSAAQLEKIAHRKGRADIELHAIVTLGKHDQHFSGHPHGPLAFKLRQLHLLGHRPVLVPWSAYFSALKCGDNLSYLRSILNLPKI